MLCLFETLLPLFQALNWISSVVEVACIVPEDSFLAGIAFTPYRFTKWMNVAYL